MDIIASLWLSSVVFLNRISFLSIKYIHQEEMRRQLAFLPLLVLVVVCGPAAVMAYSDGARSESCYQMNVYHEDSFGFVDTSQPCGSTCTYSLDIVSVVDEDRNRIPGDNTTYKYGATYEGKVAVEGGLL